MSFDFFTLGGRSNWEDIFFYQRWRIQRHINATTYRLLDPWDISRMRGSFEECRKKFIDCIEAYQLSRQKGHMVIMLHGLGDTKKIFRPLWRELTKRGLMAAALNFPSTKKDIDSHIKQFDFFLNNLEDVDEISFVVKGSSCLILRRLFEISSPWQKKLHINRVLFINPNNAGSDVLSWLAKFSFFRWLLGPMVMEISSQKARLIPKLPSDIEQGTIFCDSLAKRFVRFFTRPYDGVPIYDENSEEAYAVNPLYINGNSTQLFKNRQVLDASVNFLQTGKFY